MIETVKINKNYTNNYVYFTCSEGWCLHSRSSTTQQLHQTRGHTSIQHSLDTVIGTIGDVTQRPARICGRLNVLREQQPGEQGQRWFHYLERRRRFASAQVGQRPGGVADSGQAGVLIESLQKGKSTGNQGKYSTRKVKIKFHEHFKKVKYAH